MTFRGICSNKTRDPVKERLDPYFKPLAAAYKEICFEQEKKKRAFFGLRDFYRYMNRFIFFKISAFNVFRSFMIENQLIPFETF